MAAGQARIASLERQMSAVKGGLATLAAAMHDQPAVRAALEATAAAADTGGGGGAAAEAGEAEAAPAQPAAVGVANGAAVAGVGPPHQLQHQQPPTPMNADVEKQSPAGGQTEQALAHRPATQLQQQGGPAILPFAQQLLQQHLQQMAAAGLLMPGYPLQVPLQPHQLAAASAALAAASKRAAGAAGPQQGQQGQPAMLPQHLMQDPLFVNHLLAQQQNAVSSGGTAGRLPAGTAAPPAGAPSGSARPGPRGRSPNRSLGGSRF